MIKIKVFYINLLIFGIIHFTYSQNTHWANKVEAFSSEPNIRLLGKEGHAVQVLGKPSKYPIMDSTSAAWRPYSPNSKEEYIIVSFDTIMAIRQIAIFENYNAGTISEIYGLDFDNNLKLLKRMPRNYNNKNSFVTNITLDNITSFNIKSLKIVFDPSRNINGAFQIDAIGISQSSKPIQDELILPSDPNAKFYRERLGNDINSPTQELAPIVSPDDKILYFTRWKHPKNIGEQKNQNIWYSLKDAEGNWDKPQLFPAPINNEYDNSICSITADGKTILLNNIYQKDGSMDIGVSKSFRLRTGGWSIPQTIKIEGFHNKSKFSEYAISPDGKIIIFAAEMNDSWGGKDLYVTFEKENNVWSQPVNLGPNINSGEDESTPFIAPDGITLYFSSSGRIGYGSNDIYLTRRLSSNWLSWSEPENLGPIVNTPYWDGYFSLSAKGDFAYFSSSMNSLGKEDIFRLRLPDKIKPELLIKFEMNVLNEESKEKIPAKILFRTLDNKDTINYQYDPYLGSINFMWAAKKPFEIIIHKKNYIPFRKYFNFTNLKEYEEITENILLKELKLKEKFILNDINFEKGKSDLLPDSFSNLDLVVDILTQNTYLNILIEGHTDNQGDWNENMKLSNDRVKSVADYLIMKGIEPNRINTKGWGSNKPIRNNMTEELRKINRRVEFTLLAPEE